ncbi:MAG: thioredoxin domain-containing protein [Proteobacteria bacterium]|nr:thioredoxin domain-containing protein [Pseudomonadota bacterium]
MGRAKQPNHLVSEASPYLRKHACDPVGWYPWGREALEKARREDRPIHLSVGYSACHWCNVLHEESFEDEATARILNDHFVNIKVDREERPDIDRIYQLAQQLLTGHGGGWPLTLFLTPDDQRPFFGGTYFPPQARHGLPAFRDVLLRVAQYYKEHQVELRRQNAALMDAFAQISTRNEASGGELDGAPLREARARIEQVFDTQHGGTAGAPKFPQPQTLERLLRCWHATAADTDPDLKALYMATLTLRRMADGGIHDQLGGGFCRYSVDESWSIPHFEKMLYDNAALLPVYAQAALATGDVVYAAVTRDIVAWLEREMRSPQGGFCSSLDADSEGHEGWFYVWTREQIEAALTADELQVFAPRFGLDGPANFDGRWHLRVAKSVEEIARESAPDCDAVAIEALLESARGKLLALRAHRVRPARDDKVLTAWNAMAIRGLAIASRALAQPSLGEAATRVLDFIRGTLWRDGRLLATSLGGQAHLNAYLDDYVLLAQAVLELQQVRFRADELQFACELMEVVLAHFSDPAAGGFFFTSDDHETLIVRSKSFMDDATPSGNGVAAQVLLRLGHLLGETRYLETAERTLRAAWSDIRKYPHGHIGLLDALEDLLNPPEIVILRGEAAAIETWRADLARLYAPRRLVLAIPAEAVGVTLPAQKCVTAYTLGAQAGETPGRAGGSTEQAPIALALAQKPPRGPAVAYVCRGTTCSPPHTTFNRLLDELRGSPQGR